MRCRMGSRLTVCFTVSFGCFVASVAGASASDRSVAYASGVIHACVDHNDGKLRVVSANTRCKPAELPISWSTSGARGKTGATGRRGATGARGPQGLTGRSANSALSALLTLAGVVVGALLGGIARQFLDRRAEARGVERDAAATKREVTGALRIVVDDFDRIHNILRNVEHALEQVERFDLPPASASIWADLLQPSGWQETRSLLAREV